MILSQVVNQDAVNAYYPVQSLRAAQSLTAIKILDIGTEFSRMDVARLDWKNLDVKGLDLQLLTVGIVRS